MATLIKESIQLGFANSFRVLLCCSYAREHGGTERVMLAEKCTFGSKGSKKADRQIYRHRHKHIDTEWGGR